MAKIQLENFVEFGQLFETYGKLLSSEKQKICEEYFSFNMTLAEIAQSRQISRQAVFDAIHKSCQKLEKMEELLHVLEKKTAISKKLEDIKLRNPKLQGEIDKILEEL